MSNVLHPQMLARLAVAMLVGALIGYERESAGKPASVRTHGMVCLGAALFTLVSTEGFGGTGDPGRVASQIVTGIGFLGAGAILHDRSGAHGLTTAASLWVTAAIGTAVGVGMIGMSLAHGALRVRALALRSAAGAATGRAFATGSVT